MEPGQRARHSPQVGSPRADQPERRRWERSRSCVAHDAPEARAPRSRVRPLDRPRSRHRCRPVRAPSPPASPLSHAASRCAAAPRARWRQRRREPKRRTRARRSPPPQARRGNVDEEARRACPTFIGALREESALARSGASARSQATGRSRVSASPALASPALSRDPRQRPRGLENSRALSPPNRARDHLGNAFDPLRNAFDPRFWRYLARTFRSPAGCVRTTYSCWKSAAFSSCARGGSRPREAGDCRGLAQRRQMRVGEGLTWDGRWLRWHLLRFSCSSRFLALRPDRSAQTEPHRRTISG